MDNTHLKLTVNLDQLFVWTNNPRHTEVENEDAAIEILCQDENIVNLARDISKFGIGYHERLIVYPSDADVSKEKISKNTSFIVAEGNRRVCALKILKDPDRAPANIRDVIKKYSDSWLPIDEIDVVVIFDEDARKHWLKRIHDGPQGGIGRKPWSPEQKTRFNGTRRNKLAQYLLTIAEEKGYITPFQRKGSFSHMARLVGNQRVTDALGLHYNGDSDVISRVLSSEDFDVVLKDVAEEATTKALGSQAPKQKIDKFAESIIEKYNLLSKKVPPVEFRIEGNLDDEHQEDDSDNSEEDTDSSSPRPRASRKVEKINFNKTIYDGLEELQIKKLSSLYNSICQLNAKSHTPLVAVGIWSFVESLTASTGRNEGTAFKDYLSKSQLQNLGLGSGRETGAIKKAIDNIADYGNITKHHGHAALFDSNQLINDFEVIYPVIEACLKKLKEDV